MALTTTETFYNIALGILGEYVVTEGRTTEKQYLACARHYESARRETLALHLWNEAKKRTIIMQEADTSSPLFGYDYKYALPDDCMRIVTINSESRGWEIEEGYIKTNHIKSALSYDANSVDYMAGQYISYDDVTYLVDTGFTSSDWTTDLAAYMTTQVGDYNVIHVEYIYDLTTISSWSPLLKQAIAHRLAIKIAPGLINDPNGAIKKALIEEYEGLVMAQARSVDGQQGTMRQYFKSDWIRSRR